MAKRERKRVAAPAGGKSRVQSRPRRQHDLNDLFDRYVDTRTIPGNAETPLYGDFSGGGTYHDHMNRVRAAEADFENLPSSVRDACDNDVGTFLDTVMTPEGRQRLQDLGMHETEAPPGAPDASPPVEKEPEKANETQPKDLDEKTSDG